MSQRLTLTKTFRFEASHVLPKHPGKCSRLHGHSWVLDVTVDGEVDPETGFVVDYSRLGDIVNQYVIQEVDHQHLGQGGMNSFFVGTGYAPILGNKFYPSSENLVIRFAEILRPHIQALRPTVDLLRLTLHETCTCECTWERNDG